LAAVRSAADGAENDSVNSMVIWVPAGTVASVAPSPEFETVPEAQSATNRLGAFVASRWARA
jgi:hypothetical protein